MVDINFEGPHRALVAASQLLQKGVSENEKTPVPEVQRENLLPKPKAEKLGLAGGRPPSSPTPNPTHFYIESTKHTHSFSRDNGN